MYFLKTVPVVPGPTRRFSMVWKNIFHRWKNEAYFFHTVENSFPWRGKNTLLPSTGMKGRDGGQRGKDLVASKILVFEGDDFLVGHGLGLRDLPAPAFVPIRWSGMGRGRDGLGGR